MRAVFSSGFATPRERKMEPSNFAMAFPASLGAYLPRIAAAIGILIVGWLIAVLVRAGANYSPC
jgi:hypothetical protein